LLTATATPVRAQAPAKTYRIALLGPDFLPNLPGGPELRTELARHGFIEGRNLEWETHFGPPEQLPDLARQAVATHPDVICAVGLLAARAATTATQTIPIIAASGFLLESGLVANLARPGRNLSGVTNTEMDTKRLELLREMIPTAHHVALLHDAKYNPVEHTAALEAAARHLGITVEVVEIRRPEEIVGALRQARAGGAEAVNVLESPMLFENINIIAWAATDAKLPTICSGSARCLASYAPTIDIVRMLGAQIARVLQGARVAELPVEQPTKFELVINLKVAKQLGLTLPPLLLARADKVIE